MSKKCKHCGLMSSDNSEWYEVAPDIIFCEECTKNLVLRIDEFMTRSKKRIEDFLGVKLSVQQHIEILKRNIEMMAESQ